MSALLMLAGMLWLLRWSLTEDDDEDVDAELARLYELQENDVSLPPEDEE